MMFEQLTKNSFAVINNSKKILNDSSSGGVFYLLSKHIIDKFSGVVYGAAVENGIVFHTRIDNTKELFKLLGSKYVKSDLRQSFIDCAQDLSNGKHVLFVGTPCQVAGLTAFLRTKKINMKKLIRIDFICHGVPKTEYWNQYKRETCGSNVIDYVKFRKKKHGWERFYFEIQSKHTHLKEPYYKNPYMKAFIRDYILLDGCYNCKYKGENRFSDITLGDFWGIKHYFPELYDKKGVSLVIVRNNLDFFLGSISDSAKLFKVNKNVALATNKSYFLSAKKPDDYDDIIKLIETNGLTKTFGEKRLPYYKKIIKTKIASLFSYLLTPCRSFNLNSNHFDVAIITDYGYSNFGNRLQNYALRHTLLSMGLSSFNLNLPYHYISLRGYFSKKARFSRRRTKYIKRTCLLTGEKQFFYDYSLKSKKSLSHVKYILVGSDQIWNYSYHGGDTPFNLGFLNDNVNHVFISYAASFGVNTISDDKVDLFRSELQKYAAISVREYKGQELLVNLGFDVKTVLDPTLLLDKTQWGEAINKYSHIKIPPKQYVFLYCLANEYKITTTLDVINILDVKSPYYISNHFDFIKLIREASIVVTDSYHAFVFSIIFGKKVILYPREEMKSRFESLCLILGISYQCGKEIDLSKTKTSNFQKSKIESLEFLKKQLLREN